MKSIKQVTIIPQSTNLRILGYLGATGFLRVRFLVFCSSFVSTIKKKTPAKRSTNKIKKAKLNWGISWIITQ